MIGCMHVLQFYFITYPVNLGKTQNGQNPASCCSGEAVVDYSKNKEWVLKLIEFPDGRYGMRN